MRCAYGNEVDSGAGCSTRLVTAGGGQRAASGGRAGAAGSGKAARKLRAVSVCDENMVMAGGGVGRQNKPVHAQSATPCDVNPACAPGLPSRALRSGLKFGTGILGDPVTIHDTDNAGAGAEGVDLQTAVG